MEGYHWKDTVIIDGIKYYGEQNVNQIVSNNFTVYFSSDNYDTYEGFILNWTCSYFVLSWSEWAQELSNGTCNQERHLIGNGTEGLLFGSEVVSLIGPTIQYKGHGICGAYN